MMTEVPGILFFNVLTYSPNMRFMATETLIVIFDPGTYDTNSFDSSI